MQGPLSFLSCCPARCPFSPSNAGLRNSWTRRETGAGGQERPVPSAGAPRAGVGTLCLVSGLTENALRAFTVFTEIPRRGLCQNRTVCPTAPALPISHRGVCWTHGRHPDPQHHPRGRCADPTSTAAQTGHSSSIQLRSGPLPGLPSSMNCPLKTLPSGPL